MSRCRSVRLGVRQAGPAGPSAVWRASGVVVAMSGPFGVELGVEVVFAGGVGQDEQDRGVGDPGRLGQGGVVADLGEQPLQGFGAGVVFAEEVGCVAVLVPAAVAIRAGVFALGGLAASFGPPHQQGGICSGSQRDSPIRMPVGRIRSCMWLSRIGGWAVAIRWCG